MLSTASYSNILLVTIYTLRDGETRVAFHSTKHSENFETGTNCTEIYLESFHPREGPENVEQ